MSCSCNRARRSWDPATSRCATCGCDPTEDQLTPVLLQILCGGTGLVLWRNARGFDTHFPDGRKRTAPIRYGVGDGGADYLGLYQGRFVGVEFKSASGRQQDNQRAFERLVIAQGGIYAVVRCEADARRLLEYLRSLP